jgi:hypothetical protein
MVLYAASLFSRSENKDAVSALVRVFTNQC